MAPKAKIPTGSPQQHQRKHLLEQHAPVDAAVVLRDEHGGEGDVHRDERGEDLVDRQQEGAERHRDDRRAEAERRLDGEREGDDDREREELLSRHRRACLSSSRGVMLPLCSPCNDSSPPPCSRC
jgi:hypothetical protein